MITYHWLMRHLIETQVAQESRGRTSIAKAAVVRGIAAGQLIVDDVKLAVLDVVCSEDHLLV